MKRLSLLLVIGSLLFLLYGCGRNAATIPSEDETTQLTRSEHVDSDLNFSGDIVLSTEYPVYDKDINRITCFVKNSTDTEYMYGEEYVIEKLIDNEWYKIPFPENAVWHSIGYMLAPQSTNTIYISMEFPAYIFTNGSYRVVKQIGDLYCAAAFELGQSDITEATPNGFKKLEKLDKDYSKEQAIADGVVVVTNGKTENSVKIKEFVQKVSENIASMLRVMQYTDEGDPIMTDIIYQVDRDNYFTLKTDNTRDAFSGSKGITETIYSYLVTDGKRIYLSNHASWKEGKDNVALLWAMDDSLWADLVPIVEQLTADRIYGNITTYKVFQPDGLKSVVLTDNPLEFGYNSNDSISETRPIENCLGIATKVTDALWADEQTILIVCETDSDLKYYEFFDIKSRSASTYTTSKYDYRIENGAVVIPESGTDNSADDIPDGSVTVRPDDREQSIEQSKASFVCDTTSFQVNGETFELQDIDPSINAIQSYSWIGSEDYPKPYVVLICHINPKVLYCTIFDVDQMKYIFGAYGTDFVWQPYSETTLIYAFENKIYNYWGDILYENRDTGYDIYSLQYDIGSDAVIITLGNPENEERKEITRINYHRNKAYDIRADIELTGDEVLSEFRADLLPGGAKELLTVSVAKDGGDLASLEVTASDGSLLWLEQAHTSHAGWNSVYLCRWNEKDYLLVFNPYQNTGYATFTYALFYFNSPNTIAIEDSGSCSFSYEADIGSKGAFDEEVFRLFADQVNLYLHNSYLLMSTENGELKYSTSDHLITSEEYETEKWTAQIISGLY